jgi:hypothetical protein
MELDENNVSLQFDASRTPSLSKQRQSQDGSRKRKIKSEHIEVLPKTIEFGESRQLHQELMRKELVIKDLQVSIYTL